MSEAFDPYYKWLVIPPEEQPPHYYRLLGLRLFETDQEAIDAAADQRMAHVRTFQSGRYSHYSQPVLNQLAAARVCLANPEKKADYDRQLHQYLTAQQQQIGVAQQQAIAQQQAMAQRGQATQYSMGGSPPAPAPADGYVPLAGLFAIAASELSAESTPEAPPVALSQPARVGFRRSRPSVVPIVLSTAVLLGGFGAAGYFAYQHFVVGRPSDRPNAQTSLSQPPEAAAPMGDQPEASSLASNAKPSAAANAMKPTPEPAPKSTINSVTSGSSRSVTAGTGRAGTSAVDKSTAPVPMTGTTTAATSDLASGKEQPSSRVAVPDEAAQQEAEQRLKDLLAHQVPQKLIEAAEAADQDAAARYVLLRRALAAAIDIGDVPQALAAAGVIARRFRVDPFEQQLETFLRLSARARAVGEDGQLARVGINLAGEALENGRRDAAQRCAVLALVMARRAHDNELIRKATMSVLLLQKP